MYVQLFCLGVSSKILQFLHIEKKDDLKSYLKEYIFPGSSNYPIAVCEKAGTFAMVMSVFHNYEHIVVSVIIMHTVWSRAYALMHKFGL